MKFKMSKAKKRSHGKIDRLPYELRRDVEKRLIKGDTYAEISKYLKTVGHDIDPCSIQRYGRPYLERFKTMEDRITYENMTKSQ